MANTRNRTVSEQRAEATGRSERVSIKFRGHTYHIPAAADWSIDAIEYMAEADMGREAATILFIRELLGNQWAPFKSRHNRAAALNDFMEIVQKRLSDDAGGDDSPN